VINSWLRNFMYAQKRPQWVVSGRYNRSAVGQEQTMAGCRHPEFPTPMLIFFRIVPQGLF
jgi:hypothetical protein